MVRRAERPLAQQARAAGQQSGDAVNLGGFDGLGKGQRRQDARQPLRQHRLAGARRPDHEHVVPARRRDFERALGGGLAAHVAEIRGPRFGAGHLYGGRRRAGTPPAA